jgi:cell division protein FtsB
LKIRALFALVLILLLLLQLRFWFGPGSIEERARLQRAIDEQQAVNAELEASNRLIEREIRAFQEEPGQAVEGRAREDLGLIREGETFFIIIQESDD